MTNSFEQLKCPQTTLGLAHRSSEKKHQWADLQLDFAAIGGSVPASVGETMHKFSIGSWVIHGSILPEMVRADLQQG